MLICYSPAGEPDTVGEGSILADTSTDTYVLHNAPSGKWAYYSMFLKYETSGGDAYYKKVAQLSVLVPYNYGSTSNLYKRIPTYYRELDGSMDRGQGGPLYRFLSVFGWDTDRLRTLLDYLIAAKDPSLSRSEELDVLADDLGVDLRSKELGAARLRSLIYDIGQIRRSTGTLEGLKEAISALTCSSVEIATDVVPMEIRVRPQRVNLLKDPRIRLGFASKLDGGIPSSNFAGSHQDGGYYNESLTDDPNPATDGAAPDTSYGSTSGYWSQYTDPASGNAICETIEAYIAATPGTTFYFSAHTRAQDSILFVSLDDLTGTRTAVVEADEPTYIGGIKYWRLDVPTDWTGDFLSLHIEYDDALNDDISIFDYLLLEENNVGKYFDGDSIWGGWVVDESGQVSDYQWYDPTNPAVVGTPDESFSAYNENFQKTKYVVNRLLPTLLPVNQMVTSGTVYSNRTIAVDKYTIVWNYLPGY